MPAPAPLTISPAHLATLDAPALRALEAEVDAYNVLASPASFAQTLSAQTAERWQPYPHLRHINDAIVDLIDTDNDVSRLLILSPPRHGKSLLCSLYTPAWYLNSFPDRRVILASYGDDFAAEWGRKVRDLIDTNSSLLNIRVSRTTSAADRWELDGHLGGMKTVGVGGQVTGRGAHLLIIDDPVKDAEDANSLTIRDKKWDWWRSTIQTRLEPGAVVLLIQCMTGDTPVLMADTSEKALRDVRPGDRVATYDNGKVTSSTVRNWCKQGLDRVFEIRMTSGVTVKANARHPFLVYEDGVTRWQPTASLKKGSVILRAIGGSGKASPVPLKDATNLPGARACVCRTTANSVGRPVSDRRLSTRRRNATVISDTATGSTPPTTNGCFPSKVESALSASSPQPRRTLRRVGTGSSALTTVPTVALSAVSSATAATLPSGTDELPSSSRPPLDTYEVGRDVVLSVVECGVEDVYDLQIDRTENFIANGLVSHNTRWHEDDLAGRILEHEADRWKVVNLPALAEDADPLGRTPGTALCPQRYDENALALIRESIGTQAFSALYQQRPMPESGGMFTAFNYYTRSQTEDATYVLATPSQGNIRVPLKDCWRFATCDLALTTRTSSDYTVVAIWDVAPWLRPAPLILTDLRRVRITGAEHVPLLREVWQTYSPSFIGIESASFGSMTIQNARRSGLIVRELKADRDKALRARDAALLAENHRLYLPRTAPWLPTYEHELRSFPAGTHDDCVDVTAYAAREILRGVNFAKPTKPPEPRTLSEKVWADVTHPKKKSGYHPILGDF